MSDLEATSPSDQHERERDAQCPYCRQRECDGHYCDNCGRPGATVRAVESIGGELDVEELWLCEECEDEIL